MTYQLHLLAHDWAAHYDTALSVIARDRQDLKEYAAKPDASEKAIAVRTEKMQKLSAFVEVTYEVIQSQGAALAEKSSLQHTHKLLLEKYRKLEAYAKSKGLDTELVNFMTLKDFGL